MNKLKQVREALEALIGQYGYRWAKSAEFNPELKPVGELHQIDKQPLEIQAAMKALTLLDNKVLVDGWISVEDQMPPDDNCWVLVCAGGAMNVMAWYDGKWRDWVKARNSNVIVSEISHWMSLPEKPTSKEASDE